MRPLLSASILSADFSRLGEQIRAAEAGGVDWIHVDVMDGAFVPNITMGPFIVETCKRITTLPIDVHLMIESPENHIDSFINAGADSLTIHIETNPHIYRTLQAIRSLGCHPGVVLNPGTPVSSLDSVLHMVDLVLVMTVNPGFSGQNFISEVVPKIAEIREKLDLIQSTAWLEVDGGISPDTIDQTLAAGAQVLVSATSIFKHPGGIAAGVRSLKDHFPA